MCYNKAGEIEEMTNLFRRKTDNSENIKRFKSAMIIYYAIIIIGITVFISVSTITKTDDVLKKQVSELIFDLNVQTQMNMDSYLSRVENLAALVFAEKELYIYDATDPGNDEYEALNTENDISDRLHNLCLMENFVDFSIIYSNNHNVGKLSNNTKDLFGEKLYEDLSAIINRERTHDGWLVGYNGNYNRVYYVKRINDNAVLVTSFYATELESVFEHPGGIEDIAVRLVEENGVMIYSSEDGETGITLDREISGRIDGYDSAALMDDDYLIAVNLCGDNWRVISSVPTEVILKETNYVQIYILSIGTVAAIVAIVLSVILSFGISSSVDKTFTSLDQKAHVDQLTGVFNKRSFETKVDTDLKCADDSVYYALILIDIDNFKSVNDTYGHAFGDKVLAGVGEIMRRLFREEDGLGRLGGDEFCVFMNTSNAMNDSERISLISKRCEELNEAFRNQRFEENEQFKGSASLGVALYPAHGATFNDLYKKADSALYISKKKGKNAFAIYGEET